MDNVTVTEVAAVIAAIGVVSQLFLFSYWLGKLTERVRHNSDSIGIVVRTVAKRDGQISDIMDRLTRMEERWATYLRANPAIVGSSPPEQPLEGP